MDPTLKPRLLATLKDEIAQMTPQQRVAARYILDHPMEFGLNSVRETAHQAGVSTYTLVKLANYLGFSRFEALRAPFRHALLQNAQSGWVPAWVEASDHKAEDREAGAEAARNALSIVSRSLESQAPSALYDAVETLFGARMVYVTAVRSTYAMAYYLHYVGRMALPSLQLIPRHQNSAIDDLNDAEPGDVLIAITVTPYSRETIAACEFAQQKGLKLLLISDSEVISPQLRPEHVLTASIQSTHHFGCFAGLTAVIEVLIALLMKRGGAEAWSRIKTYDALRTDNDAYWTYQK
ncbi:MurR/RpiR family transcriptional regulator [Thalassococcus sp. S3]|uniref:MurR/RpiR family transcriptional regulator n=1 Tax=Thalassococcus sp. S3 TaxID=2017482 RepID=UPI0010249205|nr:MurR/RpiR family transcriptional regulator [Thalassococcus sp. S3]QBF33908.1 iron dicitrate transport regulator FecR [Thalassococcus sp. S3]